MGQINFQMGRIGAFLQRFCASKDNMEFCGELLFQYALLATLRNSVSYQTIRLDLIYELNNICWQKNSIPLTENIF